MLGQVLVSEGEQVEGEVDVHVELGQGLHLFRVQVLQQRIEALVTRVFNVDLDIEGFTHGSVDHAIEGLAPGHEDAPMGVKPLPLHQERHIRQFLVIKQEPEVFHKGVSNDRIGKHDRVVEACSYLAHFLVS